MTLSCWVSSSSSFEGLYCLHIQGHTVQKEYPRAETCYVGTTDGGTGWPETAVTVGPKRCIKDNVQWRRSSMSNNDQGRQGIRDVVQAEVHFWLAWFSSQSAGPWKWRHYTPSIHCKLHAQQESIICQMTWTCSTPLWESQISHHTVSWFRSALLNPLYLPQPSVSSQTSMYSLHWQTKKVYKRKLSRLIPRPYQPAPNV